MPKYLFLLRNQGECISSLPEDEQQTIMRDYQAWAAKLGERGALLAGEKLASGSGRVVRRRNKKIDVTDGPFVETKEMAGGYWLVEADDLDQATEYAAGIPFGDGSIEVRLVEP